jgi:hypothetical protein
VSSQRPTLEQVRERLRAQGYLEAGLERAIFTAPKASGAVWPSVLGAAAAGAVATAAAALARGAVSPPSGVALVLLALFAAFLPVAAAVGAMLYLVSRLLRVPANPGRSSLLAALAGATGVFALFTAGVRSLAPGAGSHPILAVAAVSVAAFYFARLVRATALSLALRRLVEVPERPYFRRGAAAAVAVLLVTSLLLAGRSRSASSFPPLTIRSEARRPLLVVGLDGVAGEALGALGAAPASATWSRALGAPPEVWTTLATGVLPSRHGVRAFERVSLFRAVSVRPPAGSSWAFRLPLTWAGVALRLPVSGAERRAYAFWEVAARAGLPTVAVNWWASESLPGAAVIGNREIALEARSGAQDDEVSIRRFREERARRRPALATVYLPGADIDRGPVTAPAADFLVREVEEARRGREDLWILYDEGRRGHRGGMRIWDEKARAARVDAAAADAAPTILARLGIPVAADLDGTPLTELFEPGALVPGTVATYGPRTASDAASPSPAGREYLERLRSLGYLN